MDDQLTLLCRYHYDPLDRLSGAAVVNEADTQLFYRRNRLVTQIQGALHASLLRAADGLLAQQQGTAGGVDSTLLATDPQHSVLQGLPAGHVQAYTVYGYHLPGNGPPHLPGFSGERRDPVTGHYLLGNGYRAFNPVLMRFNSPDIFSPFGAGGLNAYAYCQGDPINYYDPSGHIKLPALPVARARPNRAARRVRSYRRPPHAPVTVTAASASASPAASATATSSAPGRPVATVRPVPRPSAPPAPAPTLPAPPASARTLTAPGGQQFVFDDQATLAAMTPDERRTRIFDNLRAANRINQERRSVISAQVETALSMDQYVRDTYSTALTGLVTPQRHQRIIESTLRRIRWSEQMLSSLR